MNKINDLSGNINGYDMGWGSMNGVSYIHVDRI